MTARTLTQRLAAFEPGTLFAGTDLALDDNVTQVIDQQAHCLDRFEFPNDRAGYDFFRNRLAQLQQRHGAPTVLVGMEPTNYFWKLLAGYLNEHALAYRLINPYTVRKHREGNQIDRSKDDHRDAFTIADILRSGHYTETRLLTGQYAELRQYSILQRRLARDHGRQQQLLGTTVGQVFPELRQVFKDLTGNTARAMLRRHAPAAVVAALSVDAFIAAVRADSPSTRLMPSKLRQAHALAQHSVGVRSGLQAFQATVSSQLQTLTLLEAQLETTQAQLGAVFMALPAAPYLLSVPAIALASAATFLAEIGDPAHYNNYRQWTKLAGIQPTPDTSGRKHYSRTPMSHQGRPALRTMLYFTVLRLIQIDAGFAHAYHTLQHRQPNPLTKMQAIGALMNKLSRVLWAVVQQPTFYQPQLAF